MGVGSGSSGSGGNTGSAASAPPATGPEQRVSFQTNISLVEPTTDWQFAHMLVKKQTTNL